MKTVEEAQNRINFYQFLSFLFNRELTAEFYLQMQESQMMRLLVDNGYLPSPRPGLDELQGFIQELQCEFARIFIGPGKHLPPYESVHHGTGDNSGLLWGKTTTEVNRFYKYYSFDFTSDYGGIPDHISIEFEFMWRMLEEEKKALEAEDSPKAAHCRKVQREFFNRHIRAWVPDFCEKILNYTENGFYRGLAKLTTDFLEEEHKLLNIKSR